ncbi:ribokinase [Actinoplanes philippinensis]|uniref:Ribokinase n=1 Tax=Actinoplanes philippinensis TaxID=35752 RepID=A0A1I2HNF1_9ACTN|nr:ribokinase [Actinoplanes philippinensis]SFF30953.1 ribokinase [Actinoplanes philippinensis]
MTPDVVVVGQLARDLVLQVDEMPPAGAAADVRLRREMLGGKGANQAVGLAQLGVPVALVAVCGDDRAGDELLAQAVRDGVDVSAVTRRPGTTTALIVEALDSDGQWRYLQHLPELLTAADVDRAAGRLRSARAVLVQLQQPAEAVSAAAGHGRAGDALVVLDGVPDEKLLPLSDVLRADEQEARLLTGADDREALRAAAHDLLDAGPGLVALGLPDGNLFAWRDRRWGAGELVLPLTDEKVADTTGAGDAFTAALTAALLRGDPPEEAAGFAVRAAGLTVRHPGGRPDLTRLRTGGPAGNSRR